MDEAEQREESSNVSGNEIHDNIVTVFLYCITFFFFILPIKFGSSFLPSTIPTYPENFIFVGWPGYLLTVLAGTLLIIAVVLLRPDRITKDQTYIILAWLFIGICTAAFGYSPHTTPYYLYSINQSLIAVFAGLTVAICLSKVPRSRKFILGGICGGLVYTIFNGLYQYLWGFEDNIQYYKDMAAQGVHFPPAQVSRIMQKLVFSHFTISNSFAAHIILTLPLTAYIILKKLNKEHPVACRVFGTTLLLFSFATFMSSENLLLTVFTLILGLILCFGLDHIPDSGLKLIGYGLVIVCITVLALTRSRAGILCFAAGLMFAGTVCYKGNVRKICLGILLIGLCAGLYYAPKVGSFQVRLGYYEALTSMLKEKPMGYGFGGFSEYYNRTKGAGIEESNSPHSFFFGYLGHGGIFTGLSVIACFVVSILCINRQKFDNLLKFCLIAGFSSWYFHSQLDFNIMIPGTVATAAVLIMLVQKNKQEESTGKSFSALFTALIPITITIMYFCVQHAYYQSKYTDFHGLLNELESQPPIDRVQNDMNELAEDLPFSTAHYDEAASWAMKQFASVKNKDQIQQEAYLLLADDALQKAIEINPNRSSYFTRLARIFF